MNIPRVGHRYAIEVLGKDVYRRGSGRDRIPHETGDTVVWTDYYTHLWQAGDIALLPEKMVMGETAKGDPPEDAPAAASDAPAEGGQ